MKKSGLELEVKYYCKYTHFLRSKELYLPHKTSNNGLFEVTIYLRADELFKDLRIQVKKGWFLER